MPHAIAVLAQLATLFLGSIQAAAEPPGALRIGGPPDALDPVIFVDAAEAILAQPALGDLSADQAEAETAASDGRWLAEDGRRLAYAVTGALSIGVDYELEAMEDLHAQLIEMGTVGVDYTSHNVFVRAHWRFD